MENKARILLGSDRFNEAITCLEAILNLSASEVSTHKNNDVPQQEHFTVQTLLGAAYTEIGQHAKVPPLLASIWQPCVNDVNQLAVAELLLISYTELGNTKEIADILRCLEQAFPNTPRALAVIAEHLCKQAICHKLYAPMNKP